MSAPEKNVLWALGSNVGDRHAHLVFARDALAELGTLVGVSGLYESPPYHLAAQPHFLNAVVWQRLTLEPLACLAFAKSLEARRGRKKGGVRFGPRELDVDLFLYDQLCLSTPRLELPHPRGLERPFVLGPAAEIAPHWVHPIRQLALGSLWAACPSRADITLIGVFPPVFPVSPVPPAEGSG